MRRDIVHPGAGKLKYEIREIVSLARELEAEGREIHWENIGDPVQKGEEIAEWIREIVARTAADSRSFAYCDTEGVRATRKFIAGLANERRRSSGLVSNGADLTCDDIIFFNGLGDAVAKVFGFLKREARVLGPSPAYSTLSSAEAAHSGYEHLTYNLDPEKSWMPDMEDVELKVKYNDSIAGILVINPDNPTGAVYPPEILKSFVDIARRYGLFLVFDETYANIIFNGCPTASLAELIGSEVPGLAMRSISKEIPWPGARCGWIEVYNRGKDTRFDAYIRSLVSAKRLEVCSTTLPQLCIPQIMGDSRYPAHLQGRAVMLASRAKEAEEAFKGRKGLILIPPRAALYATALFESPLFYDGRELERRLPVANARIESIIEERSGHVAPDKRFAYWLLASSGICVVPLSGFQSKLPGFRFTLLETDEVKRAWIYRTLAESAEIWLNN